MHIIRFIIAFINHEGLFCFMCIFYWLASALSCFQRLMFSIFSNMPGVQCYLDYIILYNMPVYNLTKSKSFWMLLNMTSAVISEPHYITRGTISWSGVKVGSGCESCDTSTCSSCLTYFLRSFLLVLHIYSQLCLCCGAIESIITWKCNRV